MFCLEMTLDVLACRKADTTVPRRSSEVLEQINKARSASALLASLNRCLAVLIKRFLEFSLVPSFLEP